MRNLAEKITGKFSKISKKFFFYKKIIFLYIIIFWLTLTSLSFLNQNLFKASITTINWGTLATQCTWWTFTKRYYDWETTAFFDTFNWSSNLDWAIKTPVTRWYNPYWVLSSIPNFQQKTNIKAKWSTSSVIVLESSNTVTLNKPNNSSVSRNDIAAQMAYRVSRISAKPDVYVQWDWLTYYTVYTSSPDIQNSITFDPGFFPDFANWTQYTDTECLNIQMSWCWDWTIDNWENWTRNWWETCDDWNLLNWDWCSSTCWIEPIAWICWTANWTTQSEKPIINLCWDWSFPTVNWETEWPWSWVCAWKAWWASASCNATKTIINTPVNWICWNSNLKTLDNKPVSDLCAQWVATPVWWDWNWPWSWSCKWIDLWADVNCSAEKTLNPVVINWTCWADNTKTLNSTPTNLCTTWVASAIVWTWLWATPWTWNCAWDNWWSNDPCSASKTIVPVVINWTCWAAAKAYTFTDLTYWTYNICKNWSVTWWVSPSFPTEWSTVTWTCDSPNWWVKSPTCTATRTVSPKVCWDSVIQTPNDAWVNEQCDNWALNWTPWDSCSATCTTNTPIDWLCWISHLKSFNSAPTVNLCAKWIQTTPTDNANLDWWDWTCWWIIWWSTVNCNASKSTIKEVLHKSWGWWWERWRRPLCWNWKMDFELEDCDDWNNMSWDWCSARCHIEKVCWDWNIDSININWQREQCDDWNLVDWDWCSATCQNDEIIKKIIRPKIYSQQFCWNWKIEKWEDCDDWNLSNWDFCSNACLFTNIALKPNFSETKSEITHTWPSEILYFLSILLSAWIFFRRKIKKIFI